MPLILPDRHLLIPDGVTANFAHVLEPDFLWVPHQGDLVREPPTGSLDQFLTYDCPAGLALEKTNSVYPHYAGRVSNRLANADYITAGVLCRVRQTTNSSSPYRRPIFSCENTQGGTSGFGFYFGSGSSGTKTPSVRNYQATSQYWTQLDSATAFDVNAWYLLLYCRGPEDPVFNTYGPAHRFLVWRWDAAGPEYDSAWPTGINREPFGGEGNNWALGSCADNTGYCYAQAAMAFCSPTPYIDLLELATNLFDLFAPRRERYYLPSYGGAYTGDGGIVFGGGGLYGFSGSHLFAYTGSGGIAFAGGEAYAKTVAPPANIAGLVFGGSAPTSLFEGPLPYSLGATFELTSTATYTVSATFELAAPTFTLGASFELTSSSTYTVAGGFDLYGVGAAAASQETSVLWQPYVTVGGVDLSARIIGGIDVEVEENAAPIASFSIAPTAGAVDPMGYLNQAVEVWWRHMTDPATERYRRLKFSGKVLSTDWDADLALLRFECSGDLQTKCERMSDAEIAQVFAGYWSEHIFDKEADGWQQAQDRMSTTEMAVWQDEAGAIRTTSIRAAASPDFTFTDSGRIQETLRISHVPQRDLKNTVRITLDYRFPRKRHRTVKYSWMPYAQVGYAGSVCEYLEDPYNLCTRDMVRSAADGGGWVVQGDIHYVDVWPPGVYVCGFAGTEPRVWGFEDVQITTTVVSDDGSPPGTYTFQVAQDFSAWCIGAWWSCAKRWVQSITETYTLIVRAPQSIAHIGEAASTEDYGVESQAAYDDWADSLGQDGPPSGGTAFTLPSGDIAIDGAADDPVNRAAMEYAQQTVIAAARGDILRTHRGTTVELDIPYHPGVTLDHTVKVDTARLVAQGKVRRIVDRLNVETGEAITHLSLAISRKLGSTLVTDTPVAASAPAPDPSDPPFDGHISLATHLGGRTTSPVEDEDWTGFFSDYQYDPGATIDWSVNPQNPAVNRYGTKFVVETPDIDGAWVNAQVSAAEAIYDVDIPNDLLTLTAP